MKLENNEKSVLKNLLHSHVGTRVLYKSDVLSKAESLIVDIQTLISIDNYVSQVSTTIGWNGKQDISPQELDKGLKELVASFFEGGKYKSSSKQPELGFYDQKVDYSFEGIADGLRNKNDMDELFPVELTAKISTRSIKLHDDLRHYELALTLQGKFKSGGNLGRFLGQKVNDFREK